jgi:hypothetical protein
MSFQIPLGEKSFNVNKISPRLALLALSLTEVSEAEVRRNDFAKYHILIPAPIRRF